MGGCADNLLSSHLKEDRTYHDKRKELKKLMPDLGKRLKQMSEYTT